VDGTLQIGIQAQQEPAPFAHVRAMETSAGTRLGLALGFALVLHLAIGARALFGLDDVGDFARSVHGRLAERMRRDLQVDLEPEPPPPPPPEPEPQPEPEPVKAPPAPPKAAPAPKTPEPPAPAAAQAGRVLAAEPDPKSPSI